MLCSVANVAHCVVYMWMDGIDCLLVLLKSGSGAVSFVVEAMIAGVVPCLDYTVLI